MYLIAAARAGDDDASFPSGHPAHRAAARAGKVAVLFIHPLLPFPGNTAADGPPDLLHEPCVLRPALLQIAGKHPEQCQQGDDPGHGADDAVCQRHLLPQKNVDDIQYQSRPDHGQRQPVHTVAPVHEARQRVADTLQEVHKTVPLPSASTPQVF